MGNSLTLWTPRLFLHFWDTSINVCQLEPMHWLIHGKQNTRYLDKLVTLSHDRTFLVPPVVLDQAVAWRSCSGRAKEAKVLSPRPVPFVCPGRHRDHRRFLPGDYGIPVGIGPSPPAGVGWPQLLYHLIQRLSVVVQRGNVASVLGSARSLESQDFFETSWLFFFLVLFFSVPFLKFEIR